MQVCVGGGGGGGGGGGEEALIPHQKLSFTSQKLFGILNLYVVTVEN